MLRKNPKKLPELLRPMLVDFIDNKQNSFYFQIKLIGIISSKNFRHCTPKLVPQVIRFALC